MSGLDTVLRAGATDRLLVESMEKFIDAYDAWAMSSEQCGGDLFDRMLAARSRLACIAPLIMGNAHAPASGEMDR